MKNLKLVVKPLCFVGLLMLASVSYGQTVTIFVGSSGALNSFGASGITKDPLTSAAGPCAATDGGGTNGYNLWTAKSTSAIFPVAVDSNRNASFPDEAGNVWIEWDNSASPTVVCAYLSVDSIVGNRMLFGTYAAGGHATFRFDSSPNTAGDPAVPSGANCSGGTSQAGALNLPGYTDQNATATPNGLPCTIYTALVGKQFAAAVSDIRPEDAEYAAQRAAGPCSGGNCATGGSKNTGLGYGGAALGLPGVAVKSAFTNTSAQVIGYYLSGTDPATGVAVLGGGGYTTTDVGAYPVIIFVGLNRPATPCATDFAVQTPANVPSHTLAFLYGGAFAANASYFSAASRTTDLDNLLSTQSSADGGSGLNGCPLTILEREPISGTFNTFEWQVSQASGVTLSQEDYVDPTGSKEPINCFTPPTGTPSLCGNPLWLTYADGTVRTRVIGTGEMVKAADGAELESCTVTPPATCPAAPNAVGYAFWTFSTFAGSAPETNLRYLRVDGVDPIASSYTNGVFPGGTGSQWAACPPLPCHVPFTNLINGGYRIWNIIRMIQPNATAVADNTAAGAPTTAEETLASALVAAGQDQADPTSGNLTDFVPFQDHSGHILNVFRSHYAIPNIYQFGTGACTACGDITAGAILNGTNSFAFAGQPVYADNGGDMAGAIFYDQNDMDYLNDFGAVITGWRQ
jgi:hypothetical protein